LAGQFAFAAPQPSAQPAKSCCGPHCCCAPSDGQSSEPLPLTPTRTVSQNDWQLSAEFVQHIVEIVDTPRQSAVTTSAFVLAPQAVPLYQRHCSFLI
jgi:hypothetical protein